MPKILTAARIRVELNTTVMTMVGRQCAIDHNGTLAALNHKQITMLSRGCIN